MRQHQIPLPEGIPAALVSGYAQCWQLETWFRELVYVELKTHFGIDWWTKADEAWKRGGGRGIPPETSRDRDQLHPHMATPETDPLWFISFDSLLKIIFDDQLWDLFARHLTTKDLLKAKFTEIAPIRNRIAHYRLLHEDDLDRLRRILRDLDDGFWRFRTSYNDADPILGAERVDPFYERFADRMGFNYVETEPNKWAFVGNTFGMATTVSVERAILPSADHAEALASGKGKLYHFTINYTAENQRHMDFQRILEQTEARHGLVAHIILDSSQRTFRVTFPALCGMEAVIDAAERFHQVCANTFTHSFREVIERQLENSGEDLTANPFRAYELCLQKFEKIAADWPHYVIPPGHPYSVLNPNTPCRFFDTD